MVKKCLLFLISFFLLVLGGCAESSGASAGKIIPPSGQVSPIAGKWTVLQELGTKGSLEFTIQQWEGSDVQFTGSAASFGGQVWDKLSYKIKRVNAEDYLATKFISPYDISALKTQEADVITVYASSNYLGELMKLDDTSMIFFVQNKNFLLEKVSDQADSTLGTANTNAQDLNQGSREDSSGVLLGLRIPEGEGYTYRTLWVAADHHQLHPVLNAQQLFFPRTSGFWELSVRDLSEEGGTGNRLTARNASGKVSQTETPGDQAQAQISTDPAVRIIDYIGNDYVAIEKEVSGVNQLQMLPVDNLWSTSEIKVPDLLGDEGLSAYLSAREHAAAVLRDKGISSIEKDEFGKNFGLARKNGHWVLVGRLNYQSGGKNEHIDFDLKIIPPANLIYYDTLVLNWHKIKDRVPDALDAFTSPNKDIVLVKTKNKLTVYPIGAEQLEENPIAELELQEGTTVIMAEWASGSYVDSWEKSFAAYGAKALSESSVWIR